MHRTIIRPLKHELVRRLAWAVTGYHGQRVLDLLQESQWWEADRLRALRDEKLRRLISHCYLNVPYYRQVMSEASLRPADFQTLSDLPKLPVLTKELLRANEKALLAENIPVRCTAVTQTGGTTGEPISVRRTKADSAWQNQCYVRGLGWGGLAPGARRINLFGGSLGQKMHEPWPHKLWHRLTNVSVPLAAFQLSSHTVSGYLDRIEQAGCPHMIGYGSASYLLAVLAEQAGRKLSLATVFATAEHVPPAWKVKIASVFGCAVLCYYGCGEVNSLGYQCQQGEAYHRCDEHAVLEVRHLDGSTSFEGEGPLLVSDLDNYAMPIMRYQNGDYVALTDSVCSCGRSGGLISRLDGRVNDFLVSSTGELISGVIATHTFRHVQGVLFYQYVQDRPGCVTVRMVTGNGFDRQAEERRIKDILSDNLGPSTQVLFEYPDHIERTAAGKARFVINNYLASSGETGAKP